MEKIEQEIEYIINFIHEAESYLIEHKHRVDNRNNETNFI